MTAVFNRLGPYEIREEIGRGGMAQVFLANDTRTDRLVALKVVPPGRDHEAREVLAAERAGAELQRQFSRVSTHVPAVFEHGDDESGYFLVAMEYLDGENLSDVIARGPIPVERSITIASELCACLERAHHFAPDDGDRPMRLVHGDLKPRNVRITSNGSVKVLDFGIAKALSLSRKVTRNDFGTMPYLSPERLDTVEVNEFSDLWAVGVMLYEMIRGTRPFDAPDTQRLERIIRARVPPLPLTGGCPFGLEAVIARLLGPNPAVRYDCARAVREDLERFTSGKTTQAEELGWPSRNTGADPSAPADTEATRRTRLPAVDPDATRKTLKPMATAKAGPLSPQSSARPAPAWPLAAARQGLQRLRLDQKVARGLLVLLLLVVFAALANEFSVAADARRLTADVSTRELDRLDDLWAAHDRLAQRSSLHWGTIGLERALTQRTLTLAERIIANYRMALPTVREAQWQSARNALARAIKASGGDRVLRADFRYCDGHLHRINGEAHKRRHEDAEAQRELTEAVASFREAADIRRDWPDPFLGLARTFIYGLEDIDRGADALNEARRRGYMPTERETVQLADGYRTRGNSLMRSANQLSGMSQESDYLTRAVEAYQRALGLYAQATSVPNVPMNIRATQRAHDLAQQRLDGLSLTPAEGGGSPDAGPPAETAPSQGERPLEPVRSDTVARWR
ncbi:MAG TPA: serine/threonine-protein kinase [Vicinamibacterales bacterium]|jgi:serine/threonine protein kinase